MKRKLQSAEEFFYGDRAREWTESTSKHEYPYEAVEETINVLEYVARSTAIAWAKLVSAEKEVDDADVKAALRAQARLLNATLEEIDRIRYELGWVAVSLERSYSDGGINSPVPWRTDGNDSKMDPLVFWMETGRDWDKEASERDKEWERQLSNGLERGDAE